MGRKRQEQVTGKTFEERVKLAQKVNINRFLKKIGLFGKKPKLYANIRRDGIAETNPKLIKTEDM